MKVRVFISQPMNGLTNEEILGRRIELIEKFKSFVNPNKTRSTRSMDSFEFIDSFNKDNDIVAKGRIAMLGHSISLMADADLVIAANGAESSSGCICELTVAEQYGIFVLHEELIDELMDLMKLIL